MSGINFSLSCSLSSSENSTVSVAACVCVRVYACEMHSKTSEALLYYTLNFFPILLTRCIRRSFNLCANIHSLAVHTNNGVYVFYPHAGLVCVCVYSKEEDGARATRGENEQTI